MAQMPGGFGTTTEEMDRAARHVGAVNESVRGELSTLEARLEALQGLWVGEAYGSFVALMARWHADARSLNEALRSIGDALQGSRVTYEQQETTQTADIASITAALG